MIMRLKSFSQVSFPCLRPISRFAERNQAETRRSPQHSCCCERLYRRRDSFRPDQLLALSCSLRSCQPVYQYPSRPPSMTSRDRGRALEPPLKACRAPVGVTCIGTGSREDNNKPHPASLLIDPKTRACEHVFLPTQQ